MLLCEAGCPLRYVLLVWVDASLAPPRDVRGSLVCQHRAVGQRAAVIPPRHAAARHLQAIYRRVVIPQPHATYRAPRSLVPTGVEKEASFDATEEEVSPALAVSGRLCADFLAVACIVNFLILHLIDFLTHNS